MSHHNRRWRQTPESAILEPLEPRALFTATSALPALGQLSDAEQHIVADINGDGRPDVVAPTGDGFQVRFRKPSGLEAVFNVAVASPIGFRVEHIAVGRFDADERLDVAIAGRDYPMPGAWASPGRIEIFSSRRGGRFVSLAAVPAKGVVALVSGDFDTSAADGRDELMVERALPAAHSPVRIELRRYVVADGRVRSAGKLSEWTGTITRPVVTDVDGDGRVDVLLGVRAGTYLLDANVQLFRGAGNGTFSRQELYRFTTGAAISGIAVGDVNGDGRTDVAIASWDGRSTSLSYLAARPAGGFDSPSTRVMIGSIDPLLPANPAAVSVTLGPGFAIGDFDHDGLSETRVAVERTFDATPGSRPTFVTEIFTLTFEADGMGGFASRLGF